MKYIIAAVVIACILVGGILLYNKQQILPPQNGQVVPTVVTVRDPWWHWPWWFGRRSYPSEYRVRRDYGPHYRPGPIHGRVGALRGHPRGPVRY